MTFTINATVVNVTPIQEGDKEVSHIRLTATTGKDVTSHGQVMQAIYSNTEGAIEHVKIDLFVSGSKQPLAEGDVVSFTGHFTAHPETTDPPEQKG